MKLFATNRNGAEAIDVLLRNLTIRADRLTGLGTVIRTVFGETVYGEPTGIEDGDLVVGGQSKASPAASASPQPSPPSSPSGVAPPPTTPAVAVTAPATSAVAIAEVPKGNNAPKSGADQPKNATPQPTEAKPEVTSEPPKSKPKAIIPLDEVDSIHFERSPTLTARVLGQPNVDVTGPHPSAKKEKKTSEDTTPASDGETSKNKADDLLVPPPGTAMTETLTKVEPEKNGIRDLHLTLANLRDAEIKQITINCQTDKGADLLAARHHQLARLAARPPPRGASALGRPVPGAAPRRLPPEELHSQRHLC